MGLEAFFEPRGIAVVGASEAEGSLGRAILERLLQRRREGVLRAPIYPVNPKYSSVLGLKAYPRLLDVPDPVDMAVIAVRASLVPSIVREAGRRGIGAAVVISGGFREAGNEELEEELVRAAREGGVRIIGPNCVGLIVPSTGVDTLFIPSVKVVEGVPRTAFTVPVSGPAVLISQSGALGITLLDIMSAKHLGLRAFVSIGNRADVDEADVITHFADDPDAGVFMVYVEGLRDGRKFMDAVKRVVCRKPVVVLKAGVTAGGSRAALSHTGSLAGSGRVYEGAFRQAGAVQVSSLTELIEVSNALGTMPPAYKPTVAVVTNAGGMGVLLADAIEKRGLRLAELGEDTLGELEGMKARGELYHLTSTANPIDMTAGGTPEMTVKVTEVVARDPGVGMVAVIPLPHPPPMRGAEGVAPGVRKVMEKVGKPVVTVVAGYSELARLLRKEFWDAGTPVFDNVETAAAALRAAYDLGRARRRLCEQSGEQHGGMTA